MSTSESMEWASRSAPTLLSPASIWQHTVNKNEVRHFVSTGSQVPLRRSILQSGGCSERRLGSVHSAGDSSSAAKRKKSKKKKKDEHRTSKSEHVRSIGIDLSDDEARETKKKKSKKKLTKAKRSSKEAKLSNHSAREFRSMPLVPDYEDNTIDEFSRSAREIRSVDALSSPFCPSRKPRKSAMRKKSFSPQSSMEMPLDGSSNSEPLEICGSLLECTHRVQVPEEAPAAPGIAKSRSEDRWAASESLVCGRRCRVSLRKEKQISSQKSPPTIPGRRISGNLAEAPLTNEDGVNEASTLKGTTEHVCTDNKQPMAVVALNGENDAADATRCTTEVDAHLHRRGSTGAFDGRQVVSAPTTPQHTPLRWQKKLRLGAIRPAPSPVHQRQGIENDPYDLFLESGANCDFSTWLAEQNINAKEAEATTLPSIWKPAKRRGSTSVLVEKWEKLAENMRSPSPAATRVDKPIDMYDLFLQSGASCEYSTWLEKQNYPMNPNSVQGRKLGSTKTKRRGSTGALADKWENQLLPKLVNSPFSAPDHFSDKKRASGTTLVEKWEKRSSVPTVSQQDKLNVQESSPVSQSVPNDTVTTPQGGKIGLLPFKRDEPHFVVRKDKRRGGNLGSGGKSALGDQTVAVHSDSPASAVPPPVGLRKTTQDRATTVSFEDSAEVEMKRDSNSSKSQPGHKAESRDPSERGRRSIEQAAGESSTQLASLSSESGLKKKRKTKIKKKTSDSTKQSKQSTGSSSRRRKAKTKDGKMKKSDDEVATLTNRKVVASLDAESGSVDLLMAQSLGAMELSHCEDAPDGPFDEDLHPQRSSES